MFIKFIEELSCKENIFIVNNLSELGNLLTIALSIGGIVYALNIWCEKLLAYKENKENSLFYATIAIWVVMFFVAFVNLYEEEISLLQIGLYPVVSIVIGVLILFIIFISHIIYLRKNGGSLKDLKCMWLMINFFAFTYIICTVGALYNMWFISLKLVIVIFLVGFLIAFKWEKDENEKNNFGNTKGSKRVIVLQLILGSSLGVNILTISLINSYFIKVIVVILINIIVDLYLLLVVKKINLIMGKNEENTA